MSSTLQCFLGDLTVKVNLVIKFFKSRKVLMINRLTTR